MEEIDVIKMGRKRKQIQAQIRRLSAMRDQFVARERARLAAEAPAEAADAAEPLADAIEAAIDAQLDNK